MNQIELIKNILTLTMATLAICAAAFNFLGEIYKADNSNVQEWFRKKWKVLEQSQWLLLPEKSIQWLGNLKSGLNRALLTVSFNITLAAICVVFLPLLMILISLIAIGWNTRIVLLASVSQLVLGLFLKYRFLRKFSIRYKKFDVLSIFCLLKRNSFQITRTRKLLKLLLFNIIESSLILAGVSYLIMAGSLAFLLNDILLKLPPLYSLIIFSISLPVFTLITFSVLFYVATQLRIRATFNTKTEVFQNLAITVSFSYLITYFALYLGHTISPSEWLPETFQVLVSNIVFDGVSIYLFFRTLTWASTGVISRVPAFIFLNLFISAITACSSLYFGLLNTPQELGIFHVLNVLTFKNICGQELNFGPLFWVMHTTFIPILLFLFLLFLCWLGKLFLIFVRWFFDKGHQHANPLKLTAALCGILSALLLALNALISIYKT